MSTVDRCYFCDKVIYWSVTEGKWKHRDLSVEHGHDAVPKRKK